MMRTLLGGVLRRQAGSSWGCDRPVNGRGARTAVACRLVPLEAA